MAATSDQTAVFRALADPTRRAVFDRLMRGEAPVEELRTSVRVSQPAVSQHLAVLRTAGLVTPRKQGRHTYYRAEPKGLAPLVDWLSHHQRFWRAHLKDLEKLLEELK